MPQSTAFTPRSAAITPGRFPCSPLLLLCAALHAMAADGDARHPGAVEQLVFEGKNGIIQRAVQTSTEYSYEYTNNSGKRIESIYGVIDVNHSENHQLSEQERQKLQKFDPSKPGNALTFYYSGNSGSGNWTRKVNVKVISADPLDFKGQSYPVSLLEGEVSAPGYYERRFKCWYAVEFKACLKAETDTFARRSPAANGAETIQLMDFKSRQ